MAAALAAGDEWLQLSLLREFKEAGGTRDEAFHILEELRAHAVDEQQEDLILELMDVVCGWCHKDLRIWD